MEVETLRDIFSNNGSLSEIIDGYTFRPAQFELSQSIETAIDRNENLLVEAPTGIGKTFAYLVPALLSGKKILVSTGTKALQDQLFIKDIPKVLDALRAPVQIALLKGRSNYLCHYRIEYNASQATFPDKETRQDFLLIRKNVNYFQQGDISEFNQVSEDSKAWDYTVSTAENCLGGQCPYISQCYLHKARQKAQKANLVVVNHHLFFADLQLQEGGFGEILPSMDVIVFDEAHQLPEIGAHFFGQRASTRQIASIISQLMEIYKIKDKDDRALLSHIETVHHQLSEVIVAFSVIEGKHDWLNIKNKSILTTKLSALSVQLKVLVDYLNKIQERHELILPLSDKLLQMYTHLNAMSSDNLNVENIYWVECFKKTTVFYQTPLSISKQFNALLSPEKTYLFTSATLTVQQKFDFIQQQLGLEDINTKLFKTDFNYAEQVMMYAPRNLPDPRSEFYIEDLTKQMLPLFECMNGRSFYLFTSYAAMHRARIELMDMLADSNIELFIQGDLPKVQLVNMFMQSDAGILLGTSSFWEGVDVKGQQLSCVIIDKLPFESPYDPVNQAKAVYMRKQDKDPFNDYQLPIAILALKQGFGRLIRDSHDKGIFVIGDPRLGAKHYGKEFLMSLPEMKHTRNLEVVLEFIREKIIHVEI